MTDDTTTDTDDAPTGAVDNDYDDALRDAREALLDGRPDVTEVVVPGLVLDLVTRQPLFVRQKVADGLDEYYDAESFDLLNYKMHPYLPVTIDDAVFECVFVSDITAEGLADWGDAQTYDYPEGRLAAVPVMNAWLKGDDE